MTLPTSGIITAEMINLELGRSRNALFNMGGSIERELAGVPSGQIRMMDFYGKSDVIPGDTGWTAPGTYSWVCPNYATLSIRCWGGGGAGAGSGNGGQTRFHDMLYANGGLTGASSTTGQAPGGAGGTSSGGGAGSLSGNMGETGYGSYYSQSRLGGAGGASPSGGAGGSREGGLGGYPGGGGGGISSTTHHTGWSGSGKTVDYYDYWVSHGSGGGGGGAYTTRTYLRGDSGAPVPGASYTIVVGSGGGGNINRRGGHGRVLIDWGR